MQPHIEFLQARHPMLVALSPHDNGPGAVQAFHSAFLDIYRHVQVGQPVLFVD